MCSILMIKPNQVIDYRSVIQAKQDLLNKTYITEL